MSISTFPGRARQIHLDFHTSPLIPGVGALLDPEEFGETMKKAHVNSVTLFAKCHHGHLYYETDHPARHPEMQEPLLERQIEALRRRDIRCPIYISVQCDEFAATMHSEWRAVDPEGCFVGRKPLSNSHFSWLILDMSSPYLDYLEAQVKEIMARFNPVDGLFFDMCWDQVSLSKWALAGMKERGLNPAANEDRKRFANIISIRYMERLTELVGGFQPNVPIWFNSRQIVNAREEKRFLRHIEIEALPTGQWGYSYFPRWVRYGKTLGLPLIGMTGRFHKSWADFGGLRTKHSLLYDCAQALAHGAGCSIGDQLHPTGKIDQGVYQLIGEVYEHVEKCEPWCRGVAAIDEIAVLSQASGGASSSAGVVRVLNELRYQFVFIDEDEAWEGYPLVIVPETLSVNPALEGRLKDYLARGGKILRELNGGTLSPFTTVYLKFDENARGALRDTAHVFYERGYRMEPLPGDEVLAWIMEPYFERSWDQYCSHAQTPNRLEASPYAAGLVRDNQAILALPVFRAYAEHGNIPCRQLVAGALARLLPNPMVRVNAPSHLEVIVGRRESETILHFLSYIPQKKSPQLEMVEDAVAVRNVEVDVAVSGAVVSVRRELRDESVAFEQDSGRARFQLDWIEGHEIVVITTS